MWRLDDLMAFGPLGGVGAGVVLDGDGPAIRPDGLPAGQCHTAKLKRTSGAMGEGRRWGPSASEPRRIWDYDALRCSCCRKRSRCLARSSSEAPGLPAFH